MTLPERPSSHSRSRAFARSLLLPVALLAGCGGGGGSAGRTIRASTARVLFPPARSQTDATSITVRGTASDPDGVVAVSVAGVPAKSSDGFATWTAFVPLGPGRQELPIDVTDARGAIARGVARLEVEVEPARISPVGMAFDAATDQLYVVERVPPQVIAFDLASGDARRVSGVDTGSGPRFGAVLGIDVDSASQTLYVAGQDEDGLDALFSVDPGSGDRKIVRGNGKGSGVTLFSIDDVAVDPPAGIAYVADFDCVLAVELASGATSVVSSNSVGSGPKFSFLSGIVLDRTAQRAYVTDEQEDALFAVDLATGDRTLISDSTRGNGPALSNPEGLGLRGDLATALVASSNGAVLLVDLLSGNRTIVSDDATGSGIELDQPWDVAELGAGSGELAVVDEDTGYVIRIDAASGDRVALGDDLTGSGPLLNEAIDFARDPARRRVIAARLADPPLMAIDDATGDRAVLSGTGFGAGPTFTSCSAVAVDEARDRVYAARGSQLLAVDLATGDRTLVSDATRGVGPLPAFAELAYDAVHDVLFALGSDGTFPSPLIAIDPETGDRTLVSGTTRGSGPHIDFTFEMEVDPANNRALLVNFLPDAVIAVDLVTGNRSIFSGADGGADVGAGPAVDHPFALVVDLERRRALVACLDTAVTGSPSYLLAVDLDSGDRTQLSSELDGGGSILRFDLLELGDDPGQLRAFGAFGPRSYLVDLGSGDRVIYSK
ncbi:MAG: hypothetical protein JNL90_12075 [Planctomycetes bacterium]|nr:hypothetical protein [Planctomycetota bacterium]